MFIYTENKEVIKQLEADGCKLLQEKKNGIKVYLLSPTSNFKFNNQDKTVMSNKLTF